MARTRVKDGSASGVDSAALRAAASRRFYAPAHQATSCPVAHLRGYAAMRVSHQSYEHKQGDLRIQYLIAPDCQALRPKRPGMAWQQLRASAAVFVEWLRVLRRSGWGKTEPRVGPPTETKGGDMVERLLRFRAEQRLTAARAPGKARSLGFRSLRASGAPNWIDAS